MKKTELRYSVFLLLIALFTACDPFNEEVDSFDISQFYAENFVEPQKTDTLVVMTWNIKFAGGRFNFFFDCNGDYTLMTKKETVANLERIAQVIKQYDPDVLFIQEIDVASKRSEYVNELQWLLDNTLLNYGVFASDWKSDFISNYGLGRMNSGNAILTKRKIFEIERFALPIAESSFDELNVQRCILQVKLILNNNNTVYLLSSQLSAFNPDNLKLRQLDFLKSHLTGLDNGKQAFLLGATLNIVPHISSQVNGFNDFTCESESEFSATDYSSQIGGIAEMYEKFSPAVSLNNLAANDSLHFTFSNSAQHTWNRKLDYLFSNHHFIEQSAVTLQTDVTFIASDHAPILARFILN